MRDIYTLIIRNKDHLLYFFVFFLSLSLLFNNESPNVLLIRAKANDRFSKLYSPIVWYKNNINLQNEINFLREKNIQLSLKVDDLLQSGLQNEYLNELLNFKEESIYNIRTAKVINLGSGPIFSSLTIDLGSNDGIKKNLPIITTNGIVGKTILINEETSLVQTINDANFRLSVKILPSEATGIMRFYNNDVFLAGEQNFDAATNHSIGPFYDSYDEFSKETRYVGQDYSLLPEFTISRFSEDLINLATGPNPDQSTSEVMSTFSDLFEVVGAIYNTSSNVLTIGSQFFKTYSTSDFMKYFGDFQKSVHVEGDVKYRPHSINLRCQAVKKFLPKRGFYPAERAVQISEIFARNYLKERSGKLMFTHSSMKTVMESLEGRLIESRLVDLRQETEVEIGEDYNPGFYQVIITQSDNKVTTRVIKQ